MNVVFAILAAALISLLSGCVAPPKASVAVAPVGPNPSAPRTMSSQGRLEVFSSLSQRTDDQNQESTYPVWYQHTDYYLCDLQGKTLEHVFNAAGHYEEYPRSVKLAPGNYIVEAESAPTYWVQVPVTIKRGQTTRVHLDGNWAPPGYAGKSQVVTLPNGKAVGWRL